MLFRSAHTPDFVACTKGIVAAGAVAVLLSNTHCRTNSFEAAEAADRLRHSGCTLLFADPAHQAIAQALGFVIAERFEESNLTLWSSPKPNPARHPGAASLFVYTSGSVGGPKAVVLPRKALSWIESVNESLYDWRDADRYISMLPMTHLAGFSGVQSALAAGVNVAVGPSATFVGRVKEAFDKHRPSVAGLVPWQIDRLFSGLEPSSLNSLRLVVSSAAPLTKGIANRALEIGRAHV